MFVQVVLTLLGAAIGTVAGLFAPVLVLIASGNENGSYEVVLPFWLLTVPAGLLAGGTAGFGVGHWLRRRKAAVD
jgi:hypothetical protein